MNFPLRTLLCLAIFQALVYAQVTTANFYGTVTDPTGAVSPGRLRNVD